MYELREFAAMYGKVCKTEKNSKVSRACKCENFSLHNKFPPIFPTKYFHLQINFNFMWILAAVQQRRKMGFGKLNSQPTLLFLQAPNFRWHNENSPNIWGVIEYDECESKSLFLKFYIQFISQYGKRVAFLIFKRMRGKMWMWWKNWQFSISGWVWINLFIYFPLPLTFWFVSSIKMDFNFQPVCFAVEMCTTDQVLYIREISTRRGSCGNIVSV